jgi:catechol 2,3-dioxygenase-like lactoylglutathione lyase family enzyme
MARVPPSPPLRDGAAVGDGVGAEGERSRGSRACPILAGMRLSHLGLPVRDIGRSQSFYAAYFGFDPATAQEYQDGMVIIRNADGFDLALHGTPDVGAPQPFLHFGFRLAIGQDVRAALARLRAGGIEITEHEDEADMVSFKCADPDDHRVEVYWEP